MLDVSIWIDQTLQLLESAQFERDVSTLAMVIYPRAWGTADGVGPSGRANSAREWAREGLRAVTARRADGRR